MDENHPKTFTDGVNVEVELLSTIHCALAVKQPLYEGLLQGLRQGIAELMATLGIPGEPNVTIPPVQGNAGIAHEMLRLRVNDTLCPCSSDLARRLYSYVAGVHLTTAETLDILLTQLSEAAANDLEKVVEFLTLASVEAIKNRPSTPLTLPGTLAYADSLPISDINTDVVLPSHRDAAWLSPLLREVLDLRISIANRQTVANTLAGSGEGSVEEVGENLIAALRPSVIEIRLTTKYLRQITTGDPSNKLGVFTALRDDLFKEAGVIYPPFRFAPDEGMKPNSFAFTVNHLLTLPLVGLKSDQCFVDRTPEECEREDIPTIAAINPDTGRTGSLIDLNWRSHADEAGWSSWNDLQYLALGLRGVLCQYRACFIDRQAVQGYLDQLNWAFPDLVKVIS